VAHGAAVTAQTVDKGTEDLAHEKKLHGDETNIADKRL
jgi:hypothetical protein